MRLDRGTCGVKDIGIGAAAAGSGSMGPGSVHLAPVPFGSLATGSHTAAHTVFTAADGGKVRNRFLPWIEIGICGAG